MWKPIIQLKKVFLVVAILYAAVLSAQQHVIANKDNTRPEITRLFNQPATLTSFNVIRNNGYNEIQWTSRGDQQTRRFVVEYSTNGVYFQSAGEALVSPGGSYQLQHQTFEITPLLYRIRMEDLNGRNTYSPSVLLDGMELSPVTIYPTIITGNVVNVNSHFPVERIAVFSGAGQPVYTQDVNGKAEYMAITIPTLAKGVYWIHFSGRGWKTTTKFIIP